MPGVEDLEQEQAGAGTPDPDTIDDPAAAHADSFENVVPDAQQEAGTSASTVLPSADTDTEPEQIDEPADHLPELEELELPPSIQGLAPIPDGEVVGPEKHVVVLHLRETRGRVNVYAARWTGRPDGNREVDLLEGPADHPGLQREADVLSQMHYAMFPAFYASWVDGDRRYLVLSRTEGMTLEAAFEAGMTPDALASVILQIAQALRRLHASGWAAVGLFPGAVVMSNPVRLASLTTAARIGEVVETGLQMSGYSAPELAFPTTVTGKEDVYTLGALLYRGLSGAPPGEEGLDIAGLSSAIDTPGAPQLIAAALAPLESRVDLEEYYQRLLAFKRRVTASSLALRIAAATTIGLNSTRVTNEDACGHLSWFSAYEGRSIEHAVLCVVDGMGGMEAGEVASTAALRAVLHGAAVHADTMVSEAPGSDDPTPAPVVPALDPAELVQAAAQAVYAAARGRQVGATITCATIENGVMRLAHVGDTRAYLVRKGEMTQLTRDHSLVAAMVAGGVISAEEARGHPESNKVLRSLGGQRTLPDDYIDSLSQVCGTSILQLQAEDVILVCSDGVWGQIDDDELLRLVSDAQGPEAAVDTIITAALDAGAPDNASVVLCRCYPLSVR